MAAATEENIRHEDGAWEADAGRWADGTAVEGRSRSGPASSAHTPPTMTVRASRRPPAPTPTETRRRRTRRNGPAAARTSSSATTTAFPAGSSAPAPLMARSSRRPPAVNCAGARGPRYYCVYQAGKNEACYQAAGGTGADQARATGEAVRRSLAAYGRQYVIREHDGDQDRTVGTALRGQLTPAVGTTVPEMG